MHRQDFVAEGRLDLYREHPYDGLELPLDQTPKTWWMYQDTTVDLESLRDAIERAFTAAGIEQRFSDDAHVSHEAGLRAANALPPPRLRHARDELA